MGINGKKNNQNVTLPYFTSIVGRSIQKNDKICIPIGTHVLLWIQKIVAIVKWGGLTTTKTII